MNRIYCIDCDEFMKKEKTGFNVEISPGIEVRGDLYKCPKCERLVYGDFGEPFPVLKKEERTEATHFPERSNNDAKYRRNHHG